MSDKVGVPWLVAPFAFVLSISIAGIASAWLSGSARIPFVAGLDSYLPSALGKLHPRFSTPYIALIVQTGISIRHADTVDVKFIVWTEGPETEREPKQEKIVALPHPALLALCEKTGHARAERAHPPSSLGRLAPAQRKRAEGNVSPAPSDH